MTNLEGGFDAIFDGVIEGVGDVRFLEDNERSRLVVNENGHEVDGCRVTSVSMARWD